MRATEDTTAVILLTGLYNGKVCIYRTPLSHTQPIRFYLLKRFQAHTDYWGVTAVHMNATKPVFVSCDDCSIKIWRFREYIGLSSLREVKAPLLIKCEFIGVTSLLVLIHLY